MKKVSISQKIMQVLEAKGITPAKAEQISGLGNATITKLLERDGSFHPSNAEKFLRAFNVNEEWWKTSSGEMFRTEEQKNEGSPGVENSQFIDMISTGDYIGMHNKAWFELEETMKLQRELLRESSRLTAKLVTEITEIAKVIAASGGAHRRK